MEPVIGIDLGTTNSVVSHTSDDGITTVISGTDGMRILPSVVFFPEDGSAPVVGDFAKKQAVIKPDRVARLFKRGMGEKTFLPGGHDFVVDGKVWPPEELSALVLKKLKQMAEEHFGQSVSKAIITVPAYFGDPERTATAKAGEIAGLDVMQVVNEPTAAAFAHGLDEDAKGGLVLVFDLGGGTFDVTIMRVEDDRQMTVLGSDGDRKLGGADFDNLILEAMVDKALAETGQDLRQDPYELSEAIESAEDIKKELSTRPSASARLIVGGSRVIFEMTEQQFRGRLSNYLEEVEDHIHNAVETAGCSIEDITTALMVGGSSRIPAFIDVVRDTLELEPSFSKNLDEDVARGASILAVVRDAANDSSRQLSGTIGILPPPVDSATRGLGTTVQVDESGTMANQVMIQKGTPLPAKVEEAFSTVSEGQTHVEMDLNEGEETDLLFVRKLGSHVVKFPKGPVPKGYPVKISIVYTVDQRIEMNSYDGETGEHLGKVEHQYESLMSATAISQAKQELNNMTIG